MLGIPHPLLIFFVKIYLQSIPPLRLEKIKLKASALAMQPQRGAKQIIYEIKGGMAVASASMLLDQQTETCLAYSRAAVLA